MAAIQVPMWVTDDTSKYSFPWPHLTWLLESNGERVGCLASSPENHETSASYSYASYSPCPTLFFKLSKFGTRWTSLCLLNLIVKLTLKSLWFIKQSLRLKETRESRVTNLCHRLPENKTNWNTAFGSNKKGGLPEEILRTWIPILNDFTTLWQAIIFFLALQKAYRFSFLLQEYKKKTETEIFKRPWMLGQ